MNFGLVLGQCSETCLGVFGGHNTPPMGPIEFLFRSEDPQDWSASDASFILVTILVTW